MTVDHVFPPNDSVHAAPRAARRTALCFTRSDNAALLGRQMSRRESWCRMGSANCRVGRFAGLKPMAAFFVGDVMPRWQHQRERDFFQASKSRFASSPATGNKPGNARPRATSASANSSYSVVASASAATSSTISRGITKTPSQSPTTISPGYTATPPQAIGRLRSHGWCAIGLGGDDGRR